jgi:hypothetical protein
MRHPERIRVRLCHGQGEVHRAASYVLPETKHGIPVWPFPDTNERGSFGPECDLTVGQGSETPPTLRLPLDRASRETEDKSHKREIRTASPIRGTHPPTGSLHNPSPAIRRLVRSWFLG